MKKVTFFLGLSILMCLSIKAQDAKSANEVLLKLSKRADLSNKKINEIKVLLEEKKENFKKKKRYETLLNTESIMYIWDKKISDGEIERKFNRGLSQILTKEEFKLFFETIINTMAQNVIDEKIDLAKRTLDLPKNEQAKLAKAISGNCKNEVFLHLYYKYDDQLNWRFTEKAKLETNKVFYNTLSKMGYNPIETNVPRGEREEMFIKDANAIGLAPETTQKILRLVALKDKKMKDYESQWGKMHSTSIIGYYDNKSDKSTISNDFKKELAKLITIEQYKLLFKKHLQERIDKYAYETLNHMKLAYSLSKPQVKSLKGIVFKNTYDEIAIEEYYTYNYQILDAKKKQQKIKTIISYQKFLNVAGLTYVGSMDKYSINSKFIERMKQADVSQKHIDKILIALSERELERMESKISWASDEQNQIMHFYFEDEDEEGIKKRFREKLRLHLTENQFLKIFNDVLQPRVDKQVIRELSFINSRYILQENQLKEIENLLIKRFTKEVLYRQYYDHKYDIRDQKINGAKYKFIKEFKTKMKTYGF